LLPPDSLSLFLLGAANGLLFCSFSCLPFLGPYLLGVGRGFKGGMIATAVFIAGKLIAYSVLGGMAAFGGHVLQLDSGGWFRFALGVPLILAGLSIPFVNRNRCGSSCGMRSISFFGLGLVASLVPCPSLTAVFALAAQSGKVFFGVAYGMIFGLGLILSPLIVIGGGLSMISEKIREETSRFVPVVQTLSILVMVLMGVRIIFSEV